MKIAFLSDIHANLHALEAVLQDIEGSDADQIVCLGDVVGYGAHPIPCLELVFERCSPLVAGNHDLAACGSIDTRWFNAQARHAADWTREEIGPAWRERLKELPLRHDGPGSLLYVHAGPRDPESFPYIYSSSQAQAQLETLGEPATVFVGHTHVPFDHDAGPAGRLINVGSVGQPRDRDPRAAWTLFDNESGQRSLHRVDYDIDAAAASIRKAGLPAFLAERLYEGA